MLYANQLLGAGYLQLATINLVLAALSQIQETVFADIVVLVAEMASPFCATILFGHREQVLTFQYLEGLDKSLIGALAGKGKRRYFGERLHLKSVEDARKNGM